MYEEVISVSLRLGTPAPADMAEIRHVLVRLIRYLGIGHTDHSVSESVQEMHQFPSMPHIPFPPTRNCR
jgi:hypothetical protein